MTIFSSQDGQVQNAHLHSFVPDDVQFSSAVKEPFDTAEDDLNDVLLASNIIDDDEEDIFTLSLPGFDSPPEKKKKKGVSKRSKVSRQKSGSPNTTQNLPTAPKDTPKAAFNSIDTSHRTDEAKLESDDEVIDLGLEYLNLPGISKPQTIQRASIFNCSFLAAIRSVSNAFEHASSIFSSNFNNMGHIPPVPQLPYSWIKVAMGVVVSLYILNQKHLLPRDLSGVVSRVLFWPTMPITVVKRLGEWTSIVDDNVIIGGIPFGFLGYPEHLRTEFGVGGVINMCEEYKGPCKKYEMLGIEELRLPTTDHFEPSFEDLKKAVQFIKKYENREKRVYVHCRAGHGRSAAVVFAYLLSKAKDRGVLEILDMRELNLRFREVRDVRKTLYKQPNIMKYRTMLGLKGKGHGGTDLVLSEKPQTIPAPTLGIMNLEIYEDLIKDYAAAKIKRRKK